MKKNISLKDFTIFCTNCKQQYPITQVFPRCEKCNETLEIEPITNGKIDIKKANTILERYKAFFPFKHIDNSYSLYEGFTPLLSAGKISELLKIENILLKNETQNPTWSFKDRGTIVGIQHAISLEYKKIGTVSTGNMAVSVAAYGARAGLKTYILVSSEIPQEKLAPIAIYDPILIKVKGDYSNIYFESLKLGLQHDVYFINSDVFMRVEGSKTIAFEICEQLHFNAPDYVIVPTSAGGNFRGILKGFIEFFKSGLIKKIPTMVCAQASGCSPIYNAFKKQNQKISRVTKPHTIAHAIENPFPPSGNEVLRKLKEYKGISVTVSDDEIINAQRLLASEGIFGQPAAAVPIACTKKMRDKKMLSEKDSVVCVITGSGLKYTAALKKHKLNIVSTSIDNLGKIISK